MTLTSLQNLFRPNHKINNVKNTNGSSSSSAVSFPNHDNIAAVPPPPSHTLRMRPSSQSLNNNLHRIDSSISTPYPNGHVTNWKDALDQLEPPSARFALDSKDGEGEGKEKSKMSLRKRFFSESRGPKMATEKNQRPQTAGGRVASGSLGKGLGGLRGGGVLVEGLSLKEMLQVGNGDDSMDLGVLLHAIETRFGQYFEEANIEPIKQNTRHFPSQKEVYQWSEQDAGKHSFPPHLAVIPHEARVSLLNIFDLSRLIETVVSMTPKVPEGISSVLYGPPIGNTMADIETRLRKLHRKGGDIGGVPSIGLRDDWFEDKVFGQQAFSGSNPTTIARASTEWRKRFMIAANMQGNKGMYTLLSSNDTPPESILIQDCSYFRAACNAEADSTLCSDDARRFGCASVTLYHLTSAGALHPLAVVLDWRGSMEASVCVFNARLTPSHAGPPGHPTQAKDWPWRYAKVCSQVSDWMRHECASQLTDCHFVQEALIVGTQRSLPSDHVVYNLLAPHWARTLSLNAAAREVVVPQFIIKMNGFTTAQTHSFIMDAYKRFHFTARYAPTDLSRRGFPSKPTQLDSKQFHNYVWAKNITVLWSIIHTFVLAILRTVYESDDDVTNDKRIQSWCAEMHSPTGGQMDTFPDIRTLDELANAVTMCIHIASPLHNSVNYLQGYYQSFVPNKPASLSSPLPRKLSELMAYGERDIIRALPVKDPRVWRMCEQLPHLLSSPVEKEMTLTQYARDVERGAGERKGPRWVMVREAAMDFVEQLEEAQISFMRNSEMMDDRVTPYQVLDPEKLAVSIMM